MTGCPMHTAIIDVLIYDNFFKAFYVYTSVPVPSKMMSSKKNHLIFYCHFIYFTFILFPEKKIPENQAFSWNS